MTFELWSSGGVISARNLPKKCQPTEVHTMQALQWVWSLWMEEAPPNIVTRFKFEYHQHIQSESRTGYPIATPSQFKKHDKNCAMLPTFSSPKSLPLPCPSSLSKTNSWNALANKENQSVKYPLVIIRSYWKWPFIVDFPIKNCDFP